MAGGCPGLPSTSGGATFLGEVQITPGYPTPTLTNAGVSISQGAMSVYHDMGYDVSGSELHATLEGTDGSCSCCCSEMMTGPTFMHQYNDCAEDFCCGMMDGWADRYYWPGGSSGLYMDLMSDNMYHFNVGQHRPCEKIRGGLYSFRNADDAECNWQQYSSFWNTWTTDWTYGTFKCSAYGFQEPALRYALFGNLPQTSGPYYHSAGWANNKWRVKTTSHVPTGGFEFISLCLPCMGITESTCVAACPNAQHYGINPQYTATPGPGYAYNTPFVGSMFESDNCQSDPCSPNQLCFGPGTAAGPGPTGCISNSSPLDAGGAPGGTADNVCFDCEARALFHPCYKPGENSEWANGGANYNGTPGNSGGGGGSWTCNNIYSPGLDSSGLPLMWSSAYNATNTTGGLYSENNNVVQDPLQWDNCCTYRTLGCVDSEYANFNAQARAGGYDCNGNPDPMDEYTYWDPVTTNPCPPGTPGVLMCTTVPSTPNIGPGINTHPDLTDPVTGALINYENPAVPTPCCSLQGSNGVPVHPLSWSITQALFSSTDCCTNAGCMDSGGGGAVWDIVSGGVPTHPPATFPVPGYLGTRPYYPGYSVEIGSSGTLVSLTQSAIAATNYSAQFLQDCTALGFASPEACCDYQIPGCMDTLAGGNTDIFGNNAVYAVWNFNPYATVDDGSCFFEEPIGGCIDDGGLGLSTVSVPPFWPQYPGIAANNFIANANIADTSCTWDYGCPDPYATNYDPCVVNPVTIDCNGGAGPLVVPDMSMCIYDIAGAGPGCMDPTALNYNPLSTQDCLGNQPPTVFSCCVYPVEGCTDYNATNYDPLAVNDDGSCEYDISTTQEGINWLYGTKVLLCRDPLTKEEVLMGVCDQPEIQSEIFIERGKQSVMEPNLRLGEITTMGGLINHGYKYFRIKKQ
jgi:hypothetical protein